jgi:hypothetical protein
MMCFASDMRLTNTGAKRDDKKYDIYLVRSDGGFLQQCLCEAKN